MSIYDGHPGIKEDQYGIRANVKVGSRQKGKRFKRGTPIKTITDWQDRTRVALRDGAVPLPKDRLAVDAARYLDAPEGATRARVVCLAGLRNQRLARRCSARCPATRSPARW